jgi:hypothetical protein
MPYFSADDVSISPEYFLEKCSKKDLDETFEILTTEYDYGLDEDYYKGDVRSESHRIFLNNLLALRRSWYSVTKEDAQIIDVLGKKYGAM